jgi:2'-5' RNA ligase
VDLRLFIAVELPPAWTEALAEVQAALRRRGLERLRWVRPEGIHLTLKFLGNVDERRVPELTAAIERAAAEAAPFALTLGRPGTFGPPSRPRVVWVGTEGEAEALTRLWRAVETQVTPLGFPAEGRRFAPHLTLARVPDETPREAAAAITPAVQAVGMARTAPMTISEVALMRSELGRGGARYTRLAAAPLAARKM